MSQFTPILSAGDLPSVGEGFERATLDLKAKYDLGKTACMAIDVAAFANHWGGTILVGASESDGRVGGFAPMTEGECNSLKDTISKSVANRCRPVPPVDLVPLAQASGFVLAVNVWPQLNGLVAVRVDAKKDSGGYGGDSWVFPVRTGTDAFYVTPESLPMYMVPQVRRVALLLSRIPPGTAVTCVIQETNGVEERVFDAVDENANAVRMHGQSGASEFPQWVALDGIKSVFQPEPDKWTIVFTHKDDFYKRSRIK